MYYDLTGNGAYGNLFMVNKGSTTDLIRVAITAADQIVDPKNYLMYDTIMPRNHTSVLQEICLGPLERLYVFSTSGTTTFVYTGNTF